MARRADVDPVRAARAGDAVVDRCTRPDIEIRLDRYLWLIGWRVAPSTGRIARSDLVGGERRRRAMAQRQGEKPLEAPALPR